MVMADDGPVAVCNDRLHSKLLTESEMKEKEVSEK